MTKRHRLPQKLDAYRRAAWYIARDWPVTAIAAILQVAPNTVRAWRKQHNRDRMQRQIRREVRSA